MAARRWSRESARISEDGHIFAEGGERSVAFHIRPCAESNVVNIINADWYDESKEALVVLVLNTRRRIIGHNLVTLGNLDSCSAQPREIFRPVIVAAGSAIILMHNHPSKDSTPSDADIKVTRDLIRAGQLLKIEILDHVIVGSPGSERAKPYTSLRELGYFT